MKSRLMLFGYVCVIIVSLIVPSAAFAEVNDSPTSKATILNQLNLLQGDGQGFNLNGSLKRSEATTFIVRVLGKEADVKANASTYSTAAFADVKSSDWYAPYVGYCVQLHIVSGFPDGNFHPNDQISEKAFLRLLLSALGHKAGEDFTWDTVYAYSSKVGLVSSSYEALTQDNLKYNREGAVNALYASLKLPNKQSQQTLLDIIDPKHELAPGLAPAPTPTPTPTPKPDALVSAISTIQASNETKVTVQFNETIQAVKPADIIIYESGNKVAKLTAVVESQSANELVIKTDVQKANQDYTLEISNVLDTDVHQVPLLSSTFKGYIIPEIKSDLFKISKVETVNKYMLNVYFTQPVNSNITLPQYYEILKDGASLVKGSFNNLSVKTISGANNAVSLLLKSNYISASGTYTLKITGDVASIYTARLNDGNGDSILFSPNAAEVQDFSLANVVPLDDRTVQVIFNKEVDAISAGQNGNYAIKGSDGIPRGVIKAIVSGDGDTKNKVVLLRIAGTFNKSVNYELTIKSVNDSNKQFTLPESKYVFVGSTIPTHTDLKIVNVSPEDKGTLTVYVDRKLDANSAATAGFYNIIGVSDPSFSASIAGAYYNVEEPYKIRLFLNAGQQLSAGATYKLRIQNVMMDELTDSSLANAEKAFTGNGSEYIKPLIYEAMIIGSDTIRFRTNKEISTAGMNVSAGNYTLEYKVGDTTTTKTINSISMIDAQTGIIKADGLDTSKSYKLRFTALTDYTNQYTRTSSDSNSTISVSIGK